MIINIYTTKFGNIFKEFVIINSYFNIDLSLLEDLLVRDRKSACRERVSVGV